MRNRCRPIKCGVFGGVLVCKDCGSLRRIQDEERWSCGCNDKPRHEDRRSHDAECGGETALPGKGTLGWIKCTYAAVAKLSSNGGTGTCHIEPRPIPGCSRFIPARTKIAPCNRRRGNMSAPHGSSTDLSTPERIEDAVLVHCPYQLTRAAFQICRKERGRGSEVTICDGLSGWYLPGSHNGQRIGMQFDHRQGVPFCLNARACITRGEVQFSSLCIESR